MYFVKDVWTEILSRCTPTSVRFFCMTCKDFLKFKYLDVKSLTTDLAIQDNEVRIVEWLEDNGYPFSECCVNNASFPIFLLLSGRGFDYYIINNILLRNNYILLDYLMDKGFIDPLFGIENYYEVARSYGSNKCEDVLKYKSSEEKLNEVIDSGGIQSLDKLNPSGPNYFKLERSHFSVILRRGQLDVIRDLQFLNVIPEEITLDINDAIYSEISN